MCQPDNKGFTLVEVLIVIAIFAVGAAIAIPNITDMGRKSAVRADARQIKNQLAKARVEAIKRNVPVVVEFRQPTNDYVLFIDNGTTAKSYDAADTLIQRVTLGSSHFDTSENGGDGIIIGAGNSIVWDTKGMSTDIDGGLSSGSIFITDGDSTFNVIINQMGSVRIELK